MQQKFEIIAIRYTVVKMFSIQIPSEIQLNPNNSIDPGNKDLSLLSFYKKLFQGNVGGKHCGNFLWVKLMGNN